MIIGVPRQKPLFVRLGSRRISSLMRSLVLMAILLTGCVEDVVEFDAHEVIEPRPSAGGGR